MLSQALSLISYLVAFATLGHGLISERVLDSPRRMNDRTSGQRKVENCVKCITVACSQCEVQMPQLSFAA